MKSLKRFFPAFIFTLLFQSCTEIHTQDPEKAFKYFLGPIPEEHVEVLKGDYWQSAHFTLEYIVYLKMNTSEEWWKEFVEVNKLVLDNQRRDILDDAPDWFEFPEGAVIYRRESPFSSGYFRDPETGECYIFDVQF